MSKHTPGPWRYMAGTHSHYDSEGKAIARVYGPRGIDCSRRDANARLIAAAPDLLEALRMWMHLHEAPAGYEGKYGKALDAAIAAQQVKIDAAANASRAAIKAVEEQK